MSIIKELESIELDLDYDLSYSDYSEEKIESLTISLYRLIDLMKSQLEISTKDGE